jgi:hypothetical protein
MDFYGWISSETGVSDVSPVSGVSIRIGKEK